MKKLLIALCILLAPFALEARSTTVVVGQGVAGTPATYTCTDCAASGTCDVLCEDFSGSNNCGTGESYCYTASWSATETGGTLVVGTGNTSGQSCSEKGTRSLAYTYASSAQLSFIQSVAAETTIYGSMAIRFSNFGTIADSGWAPILGVVDDSFNSVAEIDIARSGANYYIAIGNSAATSPTSTALSLNTWYHVQFHFVRNATSSVKVNGGSDATITAGDYNMLVYAIGAGTANVDTNFEIDTIKIDDDAETNSCH